MTEDIHNVLSDFCQRLTDRCNTILGNKLPAKDDDNLGLMLATFGPRQVDHLHGVGYLIQGKCLTQAGVLARSMLEGFALLYWAKDDENRSRRWRAYAFVHDLRLFRQREEEGEVFDATFKQELLDGLRTHAQDFLRSKHRNNPSDQVFLEPNCYYHVWHLGADGEPLKISDAINELDPDLRKLYAHFSKLVHWGVSSIAPYMTPTDSGFAVDTQSQPRDALQAMTMGFQACIQTFILLSVHFNLSDDQEALGTLKDDYIAALQGLSSSATS